jgi:hypothetical protein
MSPQYSYWFLTAKYFKLNLIRLYDCRNDAKPAELMGSGHAMTKDWYCRFVYSHYEKYSLISNAESAPI